MPINNFQEFQELFIENLQEVLNNYKPELNNVDVSE